MVLDYAGVNWLAVVVAAAASLVIGFVWYLPQVFGTRWAALAGRPLPTAGQIPAMTYLSGVVVALIGAYVLAVIVGAVGAATFTDGAIVGFLAWFGFVATTTYGAVLWEGQSTSHWTINAGNTLVSFVVMGAILGFFA